MLQGSFSLCVHKRSVSFFIEMLPLIFNCILNLFFRYLGHETLDVDIPTRFESKMFNYTPLRVLWLFLYPLNQAIRPYYKSPLPVNTYEIYNFIIQIAFNFAVYYIFGPKIVFYLLGGTLLSLGLHPLSGHFISEHYLFRNGHHATYSYYGPLNPILFNVGYHVEHHDFPYIPCTRIAKVKELAPEFYDHLPYHNSWVKVLWDFIFDPEMGPQSRGMGYDQQSFGLDQHADEELLKLPTIEYSEATASTTEIKRRVLNGNVYKNTKKQG